MRKHGCAFIITVGLLLHSLPAQAEEPYFVGETWGVWFSVPEKGDDPEVYPRCKLSTRVWDHKRLTFLSELTSASYIEPWLEVRNESWDLPLGRTTEVGLGTIGGVIEYELSADSAGTLFGSIDQKVVGKDNYIIFLTALGYLLDARQAGTTISVHFAGNEPEWSIPAMDQHETYQVKQAIDRCVSKLRSLGSGYYAADGQRQNEQTSPFAE